MYFIEFVTKKEANLSINVLTVIENVYKVSKEDFSVIFEFFESYCEKSYWN